MKGIVAMRNISRREFIVTGVGALAAGGAAFGSASQKRINMIYKGVNL